ncbi:RrF2 family transcriptional regulator [Thauera linaloolentis]|uniref:BadM/Rrf2 family transcriptional regulator n=1 Tax=Thauera linaloolentis (strain DSM 12138 / JCM 21573 / CCUG 41526 / CIP 105981 / IAM 15112 / NBRC 102519 / 47Lol) TaxID=1123367 RepID=N6ZAH5_THAL4|nr:Rrf2 family transcriptional regulator [Thauera linaloolentis]ENO89194.1 BadM/Rrf2 family transcriptional regulator [Thauera linaloolentis 47Lol = DSM 12138]MCM8564325.1 Rrf2 family transcriptional regulator [Thauera linaloolentis]
MNITQHTDYAFRLLMYLGACPGRRVTIREVAERFEISRSHLMKVVTELVAKGFVDGARGKGGGLMLARAPGAIGLGEVVRQMEPSLELLECFGAGSQCLLDPVCRLKGVLGQALQTFLAELDRTTLADLLGHDGRLQRVLGLDVPQPAAARPAIPIRTAGS